MNDIVRPINNDGTIGFDQFNQLMTITVDHANTPRQCKTMRHVADLRGVKCIVCDRVFELTAQEYTNTEFIRDFGHAHGSCWRRFSTMREFFDLTNILVKCGVRFCGLRQIPNEYTKGEWGPMWFRTQLYEKTPWLRIGRRKRVWEIVLNDANVSFEEYSNSCIGQSRNTNEYIDSNKILVHSYTQEESVEFIKQMWAWCQKPELERKEKENA